MAAIQSKSHVTFLDIPEPFDDETFGSWFRRLAAFQGSTRERLAAALLGTAPFSMREALDIDWDLNPPAGLIETVALSIHWPIERLKSLIPPPSPHYLRVGHRGVYCHRCWEEDLRMLRVHERRQWMNPWSLRCERHCEALSEFKPCSELSQHFAAVLQARSAQLMKPPSSPWANALRANNGALTAKLYAEVVPVRHRMPFRAERSPRKCSLLPYPKEWWSRPQGPQDIAAWVAGHGWAGPSPLTEQGHKATEVIRDLTLFVGSEMWPGYATLLGQWEGVRDSVWRDDSGNPLKRREVRFPRGTLLMRRRAVNLAYFIWSALVDRQLLAKSVAKEKSAALAGILAAIFV